MTDPQEPLVVDWGEAGVALEGGVSGDAHLVAGFPGGALVAVLDGLGHGIEAAAASRAAVRILEQHAAEAVVTLVERCHEALHRTRGAVLTLASFDARASTMTWVGVGNVDAILLRGNPSTQPGREILSTRGGVVGYQLPALRPATLPVSRGDTLVLATDGLRSGFTAGLGIPGSPQEVAEALLARYARGTDDALVVVARYRGAAP